MEYPQTDEVGNQLPWEYVLNPEDGASEWRQRVPSPATGCDLSHCYDRPLDLVGFLLDGQWPGTMDTSISPARTDGTDWTDNAECADLADIGPDGTGGTDDSDDPRLLVVEDVDSRGLETQTGLLVFTEPLTLANSMTTFTVKSAVSKLPNILFPRELWVPTCDLVSMSARMRLWVNLRRVKFEDVRLAQDPADAQFECLTIGKSDGSAQDTSIVDDHHSNLIFVEQVLHGAGSKPLDVCPVSKIQDGYRPVVLCTTCSSMEGSPAIRAVRLYRTNGRCYQWIGWDREAAGWTVKSANKRKQLDSGDEVLGHCAQHINKSWVKPKGKKKNR